MTLRWSISVYKSHLLVTAFSLYRPLPTSYRIYKEYNYWERS